MSVVSEVDKVESLVNLPLVLRILGIVILSLTVWKGVHGVVPSAGLIIGAVVMLIADLFVAQLKQRLANLPKIAQVLGALIIAITIWKGVHGFFPTTGTLTGGLALLVGGMFNKIYK